MPSNITWSHLTKPYGGVSASGHRRFPAYAEETLKRAIAAGVDPAENRLDPSMPRYRMSDADLADLVAYIKRLETDLDPGLANDKIVIGTIMPRYGPMSEAAEAVTAVLSGYFNDLNREGGIYDRGLELIVLRADSPHRALDLGRELSSSGEVFALVGAVTADLDESFAEIAEAQHLPNVAPITQHAPADTGLRRYTFYVYAGPEVQGRALVEFATTRLPDPGMESAVVHPSGESAQALARAMVRQAHNRGWGALRAVEYAEDGLDAAGLAGRLKAEGVQALFFLGSASAFTRLTRAAEGAEWNPYLFVLGQEIGRRMLSAPSGFDGRLFAAYPTSPSDHSAEGRRAFGEFHRRHGLPRRHVAAQIASYAAAKLLVEGLSQAGRSLTRENLVGSLEGLYRYETGLTPPLTYSANRRVGTAGAYVVAVDLEKGGFASGSTWVQPE